MTHDQNVYVTCLSVFDNQTVIEIRILSFKQSNTGAQAVETKKKKCPLHYLFVYLCICVWARYTNTHAFGIKKDSYLYMFILFNRYRWMSCAWHLPWTEHRM